MTLRSLCLGVASLALTSCFNPDEPALDTEATGTGTQATTDGTSTTSTSTSTSSSSSSSMDTGTSNTTATSSGSTDTGTGPVACLQHVPECNECDMFDDTCPDGFKCVPWSCDDGGIWSGTGCFPVADNAAGLGDPCAMEGTPVSGCDNCGPGLLCWLPEPGELDQGTCIGACMGSPNDPACEDDCAACLQLQPETVAMCLPSCDPYVQDCPNGQGCYGLGGTFTCLPAGGVALSGPCGTINDCQPGSACLPANAVPGCNGASCCASFCSTDADCDAPVPCSAYPDANVAPCQTNPPMVCAM